MRESHRNIGNFSGDFNHLIGYAAENLVSGFATHAGFIVSNPVWRDCKYDMIIDNESALFRCQIKGTTTGAFPSTSGGRGGQQIDRTVASRRRILSTNDVDVFIGCQVETPEVFIIPVEIIEILRKEKLNISTLSRYREAWKLFISNEELGYNPSFLINGLRQLGSDRLGQLRVNLGLDRFPKPPYRHRLSQRGRFTDLTRQELMVVELWEFWLDNL